LQFKIRGCHPLWPAFPDSSHIAFLSLINISDSIQSYDRIGPLMFCDPTTPHSPFGLCGLGWSDFARHYFRNHGCFLFLWVLRWFTSPGSLQLAMYSPEDNPRSYGLGSPIRTSPDHRLLASPRSFSQLTTSFIAYLRQGIHTHALSSLTIKFTLDTENSIVTASLSMLLFTLPTIYWSHGG
jgi:hypothetical protein